jgi:hypothetical protein
MKIDQIILKIIIIIVFVQQPQALCLGSPLLGLGTIYSDATRVFPGQGHVFS